MKGLFRIACMAPVLGLLLAGLILALPIISAAPAAAATQASCAAEGGRFDPGNTNNPVPGCIFPVGRPSAPMQPIQATSTCDALRQMYERDLQAAQHDAGWAAQVDLDHQAAQVAKNGYDREGCGAGGNTAGSVGGFGGSGGRLGGAVGALGNALGALGAFGGGNNNNDAPPPENDDGADVARQQEYENCNSQNETGQQAQAANRFRDAASSFQQAQACFEAMNDTGNAQVAAGNLQLANTAITRQYDICNNLNETGRQEQTANRLRDAAASYQQAQTCFAAMGESAVAQVAAGNLQNANALTSQQYNDCAGKYEAGRQAQAAIHPHDAGVNFQQAQACFAAMGDTKNAQTSMTVLQNVNAWIAQQFKVCLDLHEKGQKAAHALQMRDAALSFQRAQSCFTVVGSTENAEVAAANLQKVNARIAQQFKVCLDLHEKGQKAAHALQMRDAALSFQRAQSCFTVVGSTKNAEVAAANLQKVNAWIAQEHTR